MFERLKAVVTGVREGIHDGLARKGEPKFHEYILSLPKTELAPHSKVTMKVSDPRGLEFTPKRLLIPSQPASSFVINDIQIGGQSQFKGLSVPASMFTELISAPLTFDVCRKGQEISLQIENTTDEPQTFQGCFIGRIPYPPPASPSRS